MNYNYSMVQEQLIKFLSNGAVFIHYPYPVERPYDTDYVLTATFTTETATFLEFNESDLLVVWGERSFSIDGLSGYLYIRHALLCRRFGKIHVFQDGVIVFEHHFNTHTRSDLPHMRDASNANEQVAVAIRSWFSLVGCRQIFLERADGHMLNLWGGVGLPLSLLQPRPYYLLLGLGDLFFLLLGQVTAYDEEEHLCLENFDKLVHTRLVSGNSPLETADGGKLILVKGRIITDESRR